MTIIIAAYTKEKRIIGARGTIPWALPLEMQHFKTTTTGSAVVFGRKTYQGIGRPLPGRLNIVVSETAVFEGENLLTVKSVEDAVSAGKKAGFERIFLCGGQALYQYAVENNLADRMILSEINEEFCDSEKLKAADAFFPVFDEKKWRCIETQHHDSFRVLEYSRTDYTNS